MDPVGFRGSCSVLETLASAGCLQDVFVLLQALVHEDKMDGVTSHERASVLTMVSLTLPL